MIMNEPKNIQAIRAWYADHSPSNLHTFNRLVEDAQISPTHEALLALALQGFEAGREFQIAHPDVQSGAGYLNE